MKPTREFDNGLVGGAVLMRINLDRQQARLDKKAKELQLLINRMTTAEVNEYIKRTTN